MVECYLRKEVKAGRILGPFIPGEIPDLHISRFGVILKGQDTGRWRLITVDNIARVAHQLGPGALACPDSHLIPMLGKFLSAFTNGTRHAEGDVYVVKKLTKSLLGRPTIQDLKLVKVIAAVDLALKDKYPSLFRGLGKMSDDYQIKLRNNAQPFVLSTPRRVAILLLQSVRQELNRMEKSRVITKVNQPTEWCAAWFHLH